MVTNYIKGASYKEVYDLHTDSESSSILTIHAPVTNFPRQMLGGFFSQYRRFKYLGVRVKLRPASRLPADPLQISYEAGEPTIDPRDMLNPILARGYCGDSLGYFLNYFNQPGVQQEVTQPTSGADRQRIYGNGFYGSSVDEASFPNHPNRLADPRNWYLEKLYYQSLSDPHFTKIPMQRGYSRFMKPLVYDLATTVQRLGHDNPHVGIVTKPTSNAATDVVLALGNGVAREETVSDMGTNPASIFEKSEVKGETAQTFGTTYTGTIGGATNQVRVFRHTAPILTSRKRRLGWLDTDTVVGGAPKNDAGSSIGQAGVVGTSGSAYSDYIPIMQAPGYQDNDPDKVDPVLPPINMMVLVMPRAYKTEMYYRLELTHVFDFKDYRPLRGLVSPFDESSIAGSSLEWADWDDTSLVDVGPSVTSTAKNFKLIDVMPGEGTDIPIDAGA